MADLKGYSFSKDTDCVPTKIACDAKAALACGAAPKDAAADHKAQLAALA